MACRAYLRNFDGSIIEKTITNNPIDAKEAFISLVNRTELDGQKLVAVLTYNNMQAAFHRFDRSPGCSDYWRDRLDEVPISIAD